MFHAKTHVPAEKNETHAQTRVSFPHGNPRWTNCFKTPALKRPKKTDYLMLPKHLRLPYQEAMLLKKTGRRFSLGSINLLYQKTPDASWKFLIFIPKRVVKLATGRNRIKRIINEHIRLQIAQLTGGGKAIIKLTRLKPEEEIAKDLKEVLQRLGKLN